MLLLINEAIFEIQLFTKGVIFKQIMHCNLIFPINLIIEAVKQKYRSFIIQSIVKIKS